jgi:hypothetical protein
MEESLNEEIFTRLGLKFEFRPEQAEPQQEEEVRRAQAFQVYASTLAGHPQALSIAAQIVGIDLPSDMEYDELDKIEKPPEPEPAPPPPVVDEDEDDDVMKAAAWDELNTWKKKAVRYAKRGKAATFEFKTEHIPGELAEAIRNRLTLAGTPADVKAAFEVGDVDDELKTLADAINSAAEKLNADNRTNADSGGEVSDAPAPAIE